MTAFPFDHPAWKIARDAYGDSPVKETLRLLSETWDEKVADHLFFSALLHQESVYSATFLTLPHVLEMAKFLPDAAQATIALFSGGVALHAYDTPTCGAETLHSDCAWHQQVPFKEVETEFQRLLPEIGGLCAKMYQREPDPYFASGLAAALGFLPLGNFLLHENASYACPSCETEHEWSLIGDQLAVYPESGLLISLEDAALADWENGMPSRAAFIGTPRCVEHEQVAELRKRLGGCLDVRTDSHLRNFRCEVGCVNCNWRGAMPD